MTDRERPNRFNPERPNQLPSELAAFLKDQQYAALLHATDLGTVLVVKAPADDIASVRADQRADYEALSGQDELVMLFYDQTLKHALSKRLRLTDQPRLLEVLTTADRLLLAIPEPQRDFDTAKAEVMHQTSL
jgi:hypothetical protein